MAKYEVNLKGNFVNVSEFLKQYVSKQGISVNLVDSSVTQFGDVRINVFMFEKYFMRNGSYAALNLTIIGNNEEVFVSAIGGAGGQGIFGTSWGVEEEMVDGVKEAINEYLSK